MVVMKRIRGVVLVEWCLVVIPYFVLTFGGFEYLWYLHVRQSLTSAAKAAVYYVAVDHNEADAPQGGQSATQLAPYLAPAQAAAEAVLTQIGFSADFQSDLTYTIEYVNQLKQTNTRLLYGGIPQKGKMQLVGVMITVPWIRMMIFGDFASKALNLATSSPLTFSVTALMWKNWKET